MTKLQQNSNKPDRAPEERQASRVDLGRSYRKIGISAVAAAVRYQGALKPTGHSLASAPDRSTARGWSSARA